MKFKVLRMFFLVRQKLKSISILESTLSVFSTGCANRVKLRFKE